MRSPDWGERPEEIAAPGVQLNLTPLVDVVFALLIVYMVSSAAMIEQGRNDAATGQVDLALPAGSTEAGAQKATELVIQLDADGALYRGGQPTDMRTLEQALVEQIGRDPEVQVRVEADRKLTYERVMELIARLQSLGLRNVGLATRGGGEPAPPGPASGPTSGNGPGTAAPTGGTD